MAAPDMAAPDMAAPDMAAPDMAALVRAFPWGNTPLGDRRGWPPHRAGFVDALLLSPAPMASFWGDEAVGLFNDAFAALVPGSAAARLGRPVRDAWPEIAGLVAAARDGREPAGRSADRPPLDVPALALRAVAIRAPDGAAAGVLVSAAPRDGGARRAPGDPAEVPVVARTEAAPGGAGWSATPDGRIEGPGPRWFGLTGVPEAGGVADGWRRVVHPEDAERTLAVWAGAVSSGRPFDVEHRIRTGDGSYRWMRSRAERMRGPDGVPGRWQGRTEPLDWRRAVESRQALLLGLADTFRSAGDRRAVVAGAVAALGRETGAARAVYAEVEPAHHDAAVEAEWTRAGDPGRDEVGTEGPHAEGSRRAEPLDALALGRAADLEAGLTVVGSDGAGASGLAVPLVRDGRLRALFHLAAEAPRRWLPEEVSLVEDVATRSWDALERIASATLLRRNQARQSFLLVLGDRLREAVDAAEVAEITAEALGRQLHAARAGYGELSGEGDALAFGAGWAAAGTEPLDGTVPLASLGPAAVEDLGRGLTAVFEGSTGSGTEAGTALTGGLATAVAVPLIRDGRLRGVLTAVHAEPHRWSAEEIALVGEVASRMWEALERAPRRGRAHRPQRHARDPRGAAHGRARVERGAVPHPVRERAGRHRADPRRARRPRGLRGRQRRRRGLPDPRRGPRPGRGRHRGPRGGRRDGAGRPAGRPRAGLRGLGRARAIRGDLHRGRPEPHRGGRAGPAGAGGRQPRWRGRARGRLLIGISRDITDQRSVEEQLRQAQKMEAVGQLTGGIAHDFNNLLTGIIGLARPDASGSARAAPTPERYIGAGADSANRAAALTHRLLAFSRRQPLEPKPVDVNALVGSHGRPAAAHDRRARRASRSTLAGRLWPTLCDPHQLENALLNLAINARDAMPDGGRLTIDTANAVLDASVAASQGGGARPLRDRSRVRHRHRHDARTCWPAPSTRSSPPSRSARAPASACR